jgi:hypothetical protein
MHFKTVLAPRFLFALAGSLLVAFTATSRASDDPDGTNAIAACRKHVESMLRESQNTQFGHGFQVERVDLQTLNVSGLVTSTQSTGGTFRGDFRCKATRYGLLWNTKTEIAVQQ